ACKDLGRNGQSTTIMPKATYTPVANRAGSRSLKRKLSCNYHKQKKCRKLAFT
ncbi:alpha-galactosidase, partial [Lacticaseibacillus paracasei]|nr:alpha-galactosidase [Lacticaseibacillus paracasei]